jgi:hypothetical protein
VTTAQSNEQNQCVFHKEYGSHAYIADHKCCDDDITDCTGSILDLRYVKDDCRNKSMVDAHPTSNKSLRNEHIN